MIYTKFQEKELSLLGFGMMRLPLHENKSINEDLVQKMVDLAMSRGVNYFDTAYPYHEGKSEIVAGKCLKKYPRESYNLASKYPGHQIVKHYDPKAIFEEQLRKCDVDYFDFYLLHNVEESSIHVYLDENIGIISYFLEQKKQGKIKHLGFSSHAGLPTLEKFLQVAGDYMEFCQIQCNYLDWSLQDAKGKVELLQKYKIPVWVMEPVRGGKLANVPEDTKQAMKSMDPGSPASWGFRFLQEIPNIQMILSGMSNLKQMEDNLQTFEKRNPLRDDQKELLRSYAESLKNSVPCTGCRYCCDGCPMEIDIPKMMNCYNDLRIALSFTPGMYIDSLPDSQKPWSCIGCNQCAQACPQKINVPEILQGLTELYKKAPNWKTVCKEREEAAERVKGENKSMTHD